MLVTTKKIDKKLIYDRQQVNLESTQIVWLDVTNRNNQNIIEKFRTIIDYVKTFNDTACCRDYLEKTHTVTTILICSGHLNELLISQIYDLKHIWSIYIEHSEEKLSSDYRKIRRLSTNTLEDIYIDLQNSTEEIKNYEKNTSIFVDIGKKDFTSNIQPLSYWTLFISVLCNLPYDQNESRQRFIDVMRAYYTGNTSVLKYIEDFKNEYQSDQAIWWYTRDIFIFRMLNKALRQHNIELLFLCGFFVQDMYKQLNNLYEQYKSNHADKDNIITVYRGQFMSRDELSTFRINHNNIVSNSFFSTTLNRALALVYTGHSEKSDTIQSVLFEIELNLCHDLCLPFADISLLSSFPNESEVLFMIGTQFMIDINNHGALHYDSTEKIWKMKLKLQQNSSTKDYRNLQRSTKRKTLKACADVVLSHTFILVVKSLDIIRLILQNIIAYFPEEQVWILAIQNHCFARFQFFKEKNYSESISAYEQALKLWHEYEHDIHNSDEMLCAIDIGHLHKEVGFFYDDAYKDQKLANEHYDLAINSYKWIMQNGNTSPSTAAENEEMTDILYYIAEIYGKYKTKVSMSDNERMQNYLLAIEHLEKHICDLSEMDDACRLLLAKRIEYLATLYQSTSIYDKALYNFDRALKLYQQEHQESNGNFNEISKICDKLISTYSDQQQQDYNLVLKYQLIQHGYLIKKNELTSSSDDKIQALAKSYDALACTYTVLNQLELAEQNRKLAAEFYQKMVQSHSSNSY